MENNIKKYKDYYTGFQKFLIVIAGAILLGFLWRQRGEHGWGSSWGLLSAGFIYAMFILTVTGQRKKMSLGLLGITCGSFMLTTPAWGTLLHQMSGIIKDNYETADGAFYEIEKSVSPLSGVFIMLCLGFGIPVLFGLLLGRGYSDKKWKLKDFIILLAVFFAVDYLAKAFLAPFIVNLVQPESAKALEELIAVKPDYSEKIMKVAGKSAYDIYLSHFNDISFGKKILFGRNYFSEIDTVASAISGIAAILTARFIIKDKVAAKVGAAACTAFSVAITVANLWFVSEVAFPAVLSSEAGIDTWSLWEYSTGFIAGAVLTAFIINLNITDDVSDPAFDFLPEKIKNPLVFVLGFIFLFGANIVRPYEERFSGNIVIMIIAIAVSVVFCIAVSALTAKRCGIACKKGNGMSTYVSVILPVTFISGFLCYGFIGEAEYLNFVYTPERLINVLMMLSGIILIALYIVKAKSPERLSHSANSR